MVYTSLVGLTDWQGYREKAEKIPNSELFFAPSVAQERLSEWGPKIFQQKMGEAWLSFAAKAVHLFDVKKISGLSELETLYHTMLDGNINPRHGYIVHP